MLEVYIYLVSVLVVKSLFGVKGASTDSPLATKAAIEVLQDGGNAFDAAIAASAVLSVVLPHTGGLGGDGFMLAFLDGNVVAIMSSGRSPSGFSTEEYLKQAPRRGPLTVTVPGLSYLWGFISEEFCKLPLERLLRPAISLAYSGFYASYYLARASKQAEGELEKFSWSKYYKGIEPGSLVSNKEAARTLRTIATRGWDEFYYGKLAEKLVDELRVQGVDIGLEDLMEHEGYEVRPLKLDVGGRVLYELPPNTQGATTLHMITAVHELGLDELPFNDPARIEKWAEVVRVAYGFRDFFMGDPDYMEIDVAQYLEYGKARQLLLSKRVGGGEVRGDIDTTFLVVTNGEAAVGVVQSLFHPFGSGLVALGFPLQNRGYGFAKRAGLPNSPAPRKRPLHTLSILGVEEGDRTYVIGCAGGDWRPQIHARIYENLFVYGMSLPQALDSPRFIFTELAGRRVVVESRLRTPQSASFLVELVEAYGSTGLVHAALVDRSKHIAQVASDPRSEGVALAVQH
ncbi:MAG: gamma-glutamyltransferase [Sulfolobales archaeon]|nr:gamma-glutamyltransferase [Sulfolobales archaeon]MCX8208443.1 gamma-glutamyltransferase [Sulfolobales archaeon]MDW8010946.1 gamma-glutamyltransferase [Sulfolobales archaeon]